MHETKGLRIHGYDTVFITAERLLDFYAQDERLSHTIWGDFEGKQSLIRDLRLALPDFRHTGHKDELQGILRALARMTLHPDTARGITEPLIDMLEVFMKEDRLQVELGLLDNWSHVLLVDLIVHLLDRLNTNSFPPGRGQYTEMGHPRPSGEALGIRSEFDHELHGLEDYFDGNLTMLGELQTVRHESSGHCGCMACSDPEWAETRSAAQMASRYLLNPALTIAALYHDCCYPVSRSADDVIRRKLRSIVEKYNYAVGSRVLGTQPERNSDHLLEVSAEPTFVDGYLGFLSRFHFVERDGCDQLESICHSEMAQGDHGLLAGLLLYQKRDKLVESIREGHDYLDWLAAHKGKKSYAHGTKDMARALTEFYVDSAIHAVGLHSVRLPEGSITWEWNPVLVLLKLADLMSYLARPRLQAGQGTAGLAPAFEGVYFGIRYGGSEEMSILIAYDFRNTPVSKATPSKLCEGYSMLGPQWLGLKVLMLLDTREWLEGVYGGLSWDWTCFKVEDTLYEWPDCVQ